MSKLQEIIKYGSRELDVNDEGDLDIARELVRLGWAIYPEAFNEDAECYNKETNESWRLSGSQTACLSTAYDPKRWVIR